jgi:hypothetical protein
VNPGVIRPASKAVTIKPTAQYKKYFKKLIGFSD